MSQSKVLLIYTGGTIGMVEDLKSGQLKSFDFDHLYAQIPELQKLPISLEAKSFEHPIDSSDMKPEIWMNLAKMIADNYERFDGFVILHGSDTMAFTASALSFMLGNLSKSVILTGSQLPIGTIRTDGKENLITAIEIAAAKDKTNRALVPEVAIYFEYRLMRGNRTSKTSANHFNAFESANYPILAEAGVQINYFHDAIKPFPKEELLVLKTRMDSSVAIIKFFPGIKQEFIEAVLNTSGLRGLILETFGSGNATSEEWLKNLLTTAIKNGLVVVNITQCKSGAVEQGKYQTSASFVSAGVISGRDMTTETAITKLMFVLANYSSNTEIKKAFENPFAGEISI